MGKNNRIFSRQRLNQNPTTGIDIPQSKIAQIVEVLTENSVKWSAWEEAQLRELGFWRWVAFEGYQGLKPKKFIDHQKKFMLESFAKTKWSIDEFKYCSIIELGCGPLGMIEFLEAQKKIGIDSLNHYYSLLFMKLRKNQVEYLTDFSQIAPGTLADLVICFNVIDHTENPEDSLSELFKLLKGNGKFIIQVNCHKEGFEGTADHAKMHPSPLYSEDVVKMIGNLAVIDGFDETIEPTVDQEFPFMVWGHKK